MAAVICNGIGSCCDFICTGTCKICSKGCGAGCSRLCSSPLSVYVATVVLTQVPIIAFSVMDIGGIFRGCHGSYWLLGALLVALVHVLVAFYASYRVTNGTDATLRDAERHTAYERISFLLCRDPIVAVYIVVWFFYIGWLCVGSVWSVQGIMNDDEYEGSLKDEFDSYVEKNVNNKCNEDVVHNVMIVLGLGWAFFFIGPSVLLCVVCCACFSKKDYIATDAEFEAAAAKSSSTNKKEVINDGNQISDTDSNSHNPDTVISNNNKKYKNSNNNDADIRNPSSEDDIEAQATSTKATPTPRTYSIEGIPIEEVNKDATNNKLRSSGISSISSHTNNTTVTPSAPLEEQHIPEVVAEQINSIPSVKPSSPPPAKVDTATTSAKPKANTDTSVFDSVTKTFGGWFGNTTDEIKEPKMEATLY